MFLSYCYLSCLSPPNAGASSLCEWHPDPAAAKVSMRVERIQCHQSNSYPFMCAHWHRAKGYKVTRTHRTENKKQQAYGKQSGMLLHTCTSTPAKAGRAMQHSASAVAVCRGGHHTMRTTPGAKNSRLPLLLTNRLMLICSDCTAQTWHLCITGKENTFIQGIICGVPHSHFIKTGALIMLWQ